MFQREKSKSLWRRYFNVGVIALSAGLSNLAQANEKPWFVEELNQASRGGFQELRNWQDRPSRREIKRLESRFAVVETGDKEFPFQLVKLDKRGKTEEVLYHLKSKIGEGNNANVYESQNGTAVKVIKNPANGRKILLQVWMEDIAKKYGLNPVHTVAYDRDGAWIETPLIKGDSLEFEHGFSLYHDKKAPPEKVIKEVLRMWEAAKRLAKDRGIFLDFKAANVHTHEDGTLINIDFAPRLNNSYWKYFLHKDQRPLSEEEFLKKFFTYDIGKGYSRNIPRRYKGH